MENYKDKFKFLVEYDVSKGGQLNDLGKRIELEEFHKKVTGEPLFTEKVIDEIVKQSIKEYNILYENKSYREIFPPLKLKQYLPEGIDIHYDNKTVSYNPKHEDYVSTGVEYNPTQDTKFGKGIQVWSIFKRNKVASYDTDGNPLLYALKKENEWRFRSYKDEANITNQMGLIFDKFTQTHPYGPTIVIPSGGELNQIMANMIKKRNPQTKIINDVLCKMSARNVYNDITRLNSLFRKKYNTPEMYNDARIELEKYIYKMDKQRNGLFSYHFIANNEMRKVIGQTLKVSEDCGKYSEDINSKDILIIDDTISQGNSIKYACDLIRDTFIPNSITVLTLFSRL